MEMSIFSRKRFRSLHFRIVAPIIPIVILMVLLGGIVFSLGIRTVSHYANERVREDLGRNSRDVYSICDTALQNLLLNGNVEREAKTKIRKGVVLGKIDDYLQQHDLQALLYTDDGKILLRPGLLDQRAIITGTKDKNGMVLIRLNGNEYYAHRLEFELWNWHIVLLKDGKFYSDFVREISRSYYIIGSILLLATLALVFYFRHLIHIPVRSIIASIQSTGMPDYKGIYEFEFLSNIIREAKQSDQQKQQQISYQASHDALTGLLNRREFEHRLQALLQAETAHARHSILYMDLDQFKIINDTCGHNAGDVLLEQLTGLLQVRLRQHDILARLGGDEFGLLLENCAGDAALRIAEMLRQTVTDFRFTWAGKTFSLGVSIGLVSFGNDGLTLNDIFSIADGACYIAKENGRNRIHVYHPNDGELAERQGLMNWVSRISKALDEDRMVLYRQKIVSLQHSPDNLPHYEFLLRMYDETGNLVLPQAFLPAAERYNLMSAIDFWVIRTAFAYCAKQCSMSSPGQIYTINLSGATLGDERLFSYISEQLAYFKIPARAICFEITETVAITYLTKAAELIRKLKQLGCRLALDDFGSGMSSFSYLKNLPVDFVKIDGSFVTNFMNDSVSRAIVQSITNVAHVMGIQTIAEYVENDILRDELRRVGVDFAQGYGIHHPEPIENMATIKGKPYRLEQSADSGAMPTISSAI
jgi:diguanylate cyclase (GGDEF)-like protein